jgi:hypothetical protein
MAATPIPTNPWELLKLWLKITKESEYLEMKKQTEAAIALEGTRKIGGVATAMKCTCGQQYQLTVEVRKP